MNTSPDLPIPIGTCVAVRDGSPKPPERFTRKLRDWETRNYDGVVVEHNNASETGMPYASYTIQKMSTIDSRYKIMVSFVYPDRVSPVVGAQNYPVRSGMVVAA